MDVLFAAQRCQAGHAVAHLMHHLYEVPTEFGNANAAGNSGSTLNRAIFTNELRIRHFRMPKSYAP